MKLEVYAGTKSLDQTTWLITQKSVKPALTDNNADLIQTPKATFFMTIEIILTKAFKNGVPSIS